MKSNTETSIIKSNVRQINLSNENIKYKHWCFQLSKIISQKNHFGILIYILFTSQSKTQYEEMFRNQWIQVQCNPDLVTHLVCQKTVTKSRGVTK